MGFGLNTAFIPKDKQTLSEQLEVFATNTLAESGIHVLFDLEGSGNTKVSLNAESIMSSLQSGSLSGGALV